VNFVLLVIGSLLLVISLAGVALGFYMAADVRTRRRGRLFAILWVPAVAASSGILMRDVLTFTVGLVCFLIAGAVFALQGDKSYEQSEGRKADLARGRAGNRLLDSEKITKENETRGEGRVAS
jgi:membrane protein implicated in regulation of membrane protease activity